VSVADALAAIRRSEPVLLPTDTVYALAATPYKHEAAIQIYLLKRREGTKPTALLASDVDMLFECVPEFRGRAGTIARALLPGPYTLIFPNPAKRFRWLTGDRPDTIGVRVPVLEGDGKEVVSKAGAVMATSANLAGEPDPRRLDDVPPEIRTHVAAAIDGGELPGVPSTVIDCTGDEPKVVREGAGSAAEALERIAAAVRAHA
jgi:L-threonylcarbamoyladenylate synthase